MSIEFVFKTICSKLPEEGIDFLMIGGHAVNYHGYTRATMDVDFMIAAEHISSVREVMKYEGFTNVSEGENVLFFSQPGSPLRIDFLPVDSSTMEQLLSRAVSVDYAGYKLTVPSLQDLISMKVFSLNNGGEKRKERDSSDIVELMLDHNLNAMEFLKPLCDRFGTEDIFNDLRQRLEDFDA